eukprot:g6685.t1
MMCSSWLRFPEVWIDLGDPVETKCAKLAALISKMCGAEQSQERQQLQPQVSAIQGGISNLLFRADVSVSTAGGAVSHSYLVRIFGDCSVDASLKVCDRALENEICHQLYSRMGIGAGVLAEFANGRVERWFEGYRTLEPLDLLHPQYSVQIARKQAELHLANITVRGDKNLRNLGMGNGGIASTDTSTSFVELWGRLRDWAAKAKFVSESHPKSAEVPQLNVDHLLGEVLFWEKWFGNTKDKTSTTNFIHVDMHTMSESIDERRDKYDRARAFWAEACFCHHDLLSGNIMVRTSSRAAGNKAEVVPRLDVQDMRLIDFEYAAYNHRGYDVCNHFNAIPESMLIIENDFRPDLYFPKREAIAEYVKSYYTGKMELEVRAGEQERQTGAAAVRMEILCSVEILCSEPGLDALLEYCPVAELYWILWAIILSATSEVDFDYLHYARTRYEKGYLRYKKEVLQNAEKYGKSST